MMHRRQKNHDKPLLILIGIMVVTLICLAAVALNMGEDLPKTQQDATIPTTPVTENTEPSTEAPTEAPTQAPTEPAVTKVSTATIGATGDVLMHKPVITSGQTGSSYNFDYIFTYADDYYSSVDFAVANLETTLASTTNGYSYSGYPTFNCPDDIVDALKNAGFDMLLTANNHTYDTNKIGFQRTQQVIAEKGLPHIGTRPSLEDKNYLVVDINGIQVGMINYTYNTGVSSSGAISLNGIPLSVENSQLINNFSKDNLSAFYKKLEGEIQAMRSDGAEAIVLYIHWGEEYQTKENSNQNAIAQQVCNMGVDVIVGNHPHVVQPVELLTNQNDSSKKTLCVYSTGNAVSNQSYASHSNYYVEDGMFFNFTFAKYSDGTVLIESARVIPTWVNRYTQGGTTKYQILCLDDTVDNWQAQMNLVASTLEKCQKSYNRTMGIVGDGTEEANEYFSSNQAAVESMLGVE